eukprot:1142543-Pelagomonas_calceolata.AAC.6
MYIHIHTQVESTNDLTGVHKRLTNRVFAERDLPDFLVSDNYLKFSTCEECLNMPLEVSSRLAASLKHLWALAFARLGSSVTAEELLNPAHTVSADALFHQAWAVVLPQSNVPIEHAEEKHTHMVCFLQEFLLTTLHQLRTDPNFRGIFAE